MRNADSGPLRHPIRYENGEEPAEVITWQVSRSKTVQEAIAHLNKQRLVADAKEHPVVSCGEVTRMHKCSDTNCLK